MPSQLFYAESQIFPPCPLSAFTAPHFVGYSSQLFRTCSELIHGGLDCSRVPRIQEAHAEQLSWQVIDLLERIPQSIAVSVFFSSLAARLFSACVTCSLRHCQWLDEWLIILFYRYIWYLPRAFVRLSAANSNFPLRYNARRPIRRCTRIFQLSRPFLWRV